jgi:hypothetical protein
MGRVKLFRKKPKRFPKGKSGVNKEAVKSAMDCTWSEDGVSAKKARGMKKKSFPKRKDAEH